MDDVSEPLSFGTKVRYSLLTTLVVLVVVELVLRHLGYAKHVVTVPDGRVGYRFVPNQDRETDRGQKIHINSLGMRDEEFPQQKPEGEFRVLLLGDSLTFGIDVEQNETFASLLRDSLKNRGAGGKSIRVMNGAVQGYDSSNERDWLVTFGFDLQPDLVVVMFYPNDIDLEPRKWDPWDFPGRDLLRRTATFYFVESWYFEREAERLGATGEDKRIRDLQFNEELKKYLGTKAMDPNDSADKKHTAVARGILFEMSELCKRHSARLAVALIPGFANTQNPLGASILKGLGFDFDHDPSRIPHVDFTDTLKEYHPSCWLAWDPGHLSPLGHRLVAKRFESWLIETKLVPAGNP
jgi:lysophospholipase L1-like esterase